MSFIINSKRCQLFDGIEDEKLILLLKCLDAKEKLYEKNSIIYGEGDSIKSVGVVISGKVHVAKDDFWGRRTILARLEEGDLFGEAFSFSETYILPVNVVAVEKSCILFVNYRRIVTTCSSVCAFHTALIKNMMMILAVKNIQLTQKIEHISRKNTREKLLSYFSALSAQEKSGKITIPFNRQELADYLSVDRSAMSAELSKMREEGILRYSKSQIELLGDHIF